ncbi:hypothetical protein EI427_01540 [Flammeovirga pectinis]|uniref:Thioredoxin-like fold domain-containing protein n=1 Tax=Flammeovirga pectinis TaxID=2494373 RepID=A0A3Q9FLH7_9BACT|nr:thioredoxin-like domain-containing protein [Flammeovirga pectinis]AZQ60941.1 hypothetical protein EI427_01540 [Flammeovirga pectinis]
MNKVTKILFLTLLCIYINNIESNGQDPMKIDFQLQSFGLENDYIITKKSLYGKVIFMVFAASWDINFSNEVQKVKELQRQFYDKNDIEFLYVVGDIKEQWLEFKDKNGLKGKSVHLPLVYPKCDSCFVSEHFDQKEIPGYYIISKQGKLLGGGSQLPSPLTDDTIHRLLTGAKAFKIK